MTSSFTPFGRLLLEAAAVAVGFVVLFFAVHVPTMHFFGAAAMTNHGLLAAQAAIAAALFHVLFEYSGLNAWYCRQRPK